MRERERERERGKCFLVWNSFIKSYRKEEKQEKVIEFDI